MHQHGVSLCPLGAQLGGEPSAPRHSGSGADGGPGRRQRQSPPCRGCAAHPAVAVTQQHFHSPSPRKPPGRAAPLALTLLPLPLLRPPARAVPRHAVPCGCPGLAPWRGSSDAIPSQAALLACSAPPPSPALTSAPSVTRARAQARRAGECRRRRSSPVSHAHARSPLCRCTREPGPAARFLRAPAPPVTHVHPPVAHVGTACHIRTPACECWRCPSDTRTCVSWAPAVPVTLFPTLTLAMGRVCLCHVCTRVCIWGCHRAWLHLSPVCTHAQVVVRLCLLCTHARVQPPTSTRHGLSLPPCTRTHRVVTHHVPSCHKRMPQWLALPVTHTCTAVAGPESTCLAQARTRAHTSWSMFPLPMGTGRREGVPMPALHHSVAAQVSQARRAAPVSALHWGCPHQHGDWGNWVTSQRVLVLRVLRHHVPVLRVYGRVSCCCRRCGVVSWS